MQRYRIPQWPVVLIGFALIAAWPLLVQDVFLQRIGALVLLAAISASAWNLLGGYAGQVSVGHAVYFGAGAYASLVVYTQFQWPPIAGAPVGVAVSLLIALVVVLLFEVAFPLLRYARRAVGRRPVENAAHEIRGPAPERESIDRRAA